MRPWLVMVLAATCGVLLQGPAQATPWQSETFRLSSRAIGENRIGISAERTVRVWLPPSYQRSKRRFPVIYYLHNIGWSNRQLHERDRIDQVFQRALSRGRVREFIFVAADCTAAPWAGTFFGNNSVVGRWLDHIAKELVPAVDKRYRTLARASSRGVAGDYIGAYGALRVAMDRPGIFSSAYALHPIGTDRGQTLMRSAADWRALGRAKTQKDFEALEGATTAFLLMAQSHAPNPSRAPIYADLMVETVGDELRVNPVTTTQLHNAFLLSKRVPHRVKELRALRGLMLDWSRYDSVTDHVHANQKFTRVLDEYGIEHFSEEYRSDPWWGKLWAPFGRVEDRMLPFFDRFLDFDES